AGNLTSSFGHHVPAELAAQAHSSVGAAFGIAGQLSATGHAGLAAIVQSAASSAFFDGFAIASLVAAGVALAGAVTAPWLLPARPTEAAWTETAQPIEFYAPRELAVVPAGAR